MPPNDAILEAIDKMTVAQLREFTAKLVQRLVRRA